MSDSVKTNTTFNIGITMAGAGSAGCYTGGVMDYLFEILNIWEKAKNKNLPDYEEFYNLIPQHNVLIDVMGGTSAGGMTTVMSAIYALNGKINPVTDPLLEGGKKDNIFYDSWVMLDDDINDKGKKTLTKAWKLDDLHNNKFVSLLNSNIIDDIADNALKVQGELTEQVNKLPSYISKDLDVLQTHAMLRGIPLAIDFSNPIGEDNTGSNKPTFNSFEHLMLSHYKLNGGTAPDKNKFLWFNPYEEEYLSKITLTTKSTGAFPVGLRFREIDQNTFTDNYIKCVTENTIFNRFGQKKDSQKIDWSNFPTPFNFVTIDGGTINNEPFGEVLGILKSRYNECFENGYPKFGIIMIDPFPDEVDNTAPYKAPDDLFSAIPAIISTLHDQSKVKKEDMVEATENPYFRGEIFPRRWDNYIKDPNPITTSSVSAFGGFLDIKFRHYDFFLGRDNARNYLRYYFSFEYKINENEAELSTFHPIHRSWTPTMIETFKITAKDGKTYLPIIPDLNILLEKKKSGEKKDPFTYSVNDKPKYNPVALFDMRQEMEARFERILDIAKLKALQKGRETNNTETGKWMDKYYHKTWWDNLKGWCINKAFNIIFAMTKGGLARNIAEMAVKWVLTDLEEKHLLEKSEDQK